VTAFMRVRSVSSAMGQGGGIPVAIGIGTNLGDRATGLKRAIAALSDPASPLLTELALSDVFESEALLSEGAPEEWNQPFLNMVVAGKTMLSPASLLHALKSIEHKLGRVARGHWAPREIDLDILAYGDAVVQTPVLVIPHMQILARAFVLVPFAELWPHWRYPVAGPLAGTPLFALSERHFPDIEAVGMKRAGRLETL
jgi:2-amino-4-hydroxy-6-hydroxymethyldihydropteridine diphosphokinase